MRPALAIAPPDDNAAALPAAPEHAKLDNAWPVPARDKCSVISVTDFTLLEGITEKWADLAAKALEPNPFYEHGRLRPALNDLSDGADLRVVLIFAPNRARPAEPLLCGLFPLERRPRRHRLPCRTLSLWQYKFCQLATPLIRASHAEQTLEAFFAWLAAGGHGCTLMAFDRVSGEGAFHHRFVDYLDHNVVLHHVDVCLARDLSCPAGNAETDPRAPQSDEDCQDRRPQERRLLRDVVVGTGSRRADLIVSLLPLLRWLTRPTRGVRQ